MANFTTKDSNNNTVTIATTVGDAAGVVTNLVNTESTKPTFSVVAVDLAPAATATDFMTISGSATKTVRINYIRIEGDATAASMTDFYIYLRTAANTGGTPVALTPVSHDSNDVTTISVVKYTANPASLGAGGIVRAGRLFLPAAGTPGVYVPTELTFGTRNDKSLVLRGASQFLCFNWNGAAVPAGTSLYVTVEYTEEALS